MTHARAVDRPTVIASGARGARVAIVNGVGVGIVYQMPRLPRAGETQLASTCAVMPGGKGSNQALGVARLGGHAALVSALGTDTMGEIPRRAWAAAGVDASGVLSMDGTSLIGSVFADDGGENVVVVDLGVLRRFGADEVRAHGDVIRNADACLVGLEIAPEAAIEALRIAREAGVTTVLNPAPSPEPTVARELLELADVITPNEHEARSLTGEDDPDVMCRVLLRRGPHAVVITLGDRGALVGEQARTTIVPSWPATRVVDTSGAGDAFNAAFTLALAMGGSLDRAAVWGNEAGGRICGGHGFAEALWTWDGFGIDL